MKRFKHLSSYSVLACGLWFPTLTTVRAQPYVWRTIAGLAGGPGCADGTNSDARFLRPTGIAKDSAGNLYVADFNNAIRQLRPSGSDWVVTSIAGLPGTNNFGSADGTNSDARFNLPYGVAADRTGTLYVTDGQNYTIRKITPAGTNWIVSTIAGQAGSSGWVDGTNSDARFAWPLDISVDNQTNLYVADMSYSVIRKLVPVGTNWVVSTLTFTNSALLFKNPYGVALGSTGSLFVADSGGDMVRQLTPTGTNWVVSTLAGLGGKTGSADGTNAEARFNGPRGVTVDRTGTLYVVDGGNCLIRKLNAVGTNWVVTTMGGTAGNSHTVDGMGTNAHFAFPFHLTVNDAGGLFVTDYESIRLGQPLTLQLAQSNSHAIASWSALATNFVLERSGEVGSSASWLPLSNSVIIRGDKCFQTDDLGSSQAFYRLHQQ